MNTPTSSRSFSRRSGVLVLAAALLAVPTLSIAGPQTLYHSWVMRGQVLSQESGKVVLCIGKRDNAEVGQELEVIRQSVVPGAKRTEPNIRRETVGKVRINRIFDEHYSEAEVIQGEPKVNDTVELERH